MASLDTSIANAGLPVFAKVFNASFQQIQWVILSYLLAVTTLIVSVGRLGDLIGKRRLLVSGIALFIVSSVLCGGAPSLAILIGARVAQGLGAAMMLSLSIAFVGDTVSPERTGGAMGLLGTMSAIGTALGPPLGGFLISSIGWRSMFFINAPIWAVALLFAYGFLPKDKGRLVPASLKFDYWGTTFLAITLGSYALAMTVSRGKIDVLNVSLIAISLSSLLLFVLVERKSSTPLINLKIFQNLDLKLGLLISVLVSTVMMSTLVVGPFYLSGALGLNAMNVGLALFVGPFVVALTGVPAGRLVDKVGARRATNAGLIAMAIGLLLLTVISRFTGVTGYLAPIILITAGYAVVQTANNTSIMSGIEPDRRGLYSGLLSLSRNLGLITGASTMGAIFAFASGFVDSANAEPASISHGLKVTYAVAAALIVFAIILPIVSRIQTAKKGSAWHGSRL